MDILAAPSAFSVGQDEPEQLLSYDDNLTYEEQVQAEASSGSSLANRIGRGKIYLLSDAAGAGSGERTTGKKRLADGSFEEDAEMLEDDAMDLDPDMRSNALLFSGPPIAHLPTQRIFAYATHFDAHPLGLEWVSDTTCVLVFSSRSSAQQAHQRLQRTPGEEPSIDDGTVLAKPIPVPIWPAEKQLSRTLEMALGKAPAAERKAEDRKRQEEGLAGPLRMRWARKDDVKKKGASRESEFYRKHGVLAGKEAVNGRDIPNLPGGRKRGREDEEDSEAQRARLDRELDAFLEGGSDAEVEDDRATSLGDRVSGSDNVVSEEDSPPASPPSKMRSDYIATDGRTKLEKTSRRRERQDNRDGNGRRKRERGGRGRGGEGLGGRSLSERIGAAPINDDLSWGREPKRRRGDGNRGRERDPGAGSAGESRRGGRTERPKKTQQELDDELDAFLNGNADS